MRKVFVLLLSIISLASFGQPIVNRASSANTVSDARLQAAINFYLPRYADTSFAASSLGVDSTGALIYTYVPNAIWVRKANPKKWVRITDANTNPYSAGYGLVLSSYVFSVDSTVIATRGRLYKVVDSLISVRVPGLPSVLNVDNDADGKSIYNLSSLFALDTLKTNGPFQLGYGVYTTSFPRTLTANRTMVVPDQSDTLAGRTWTRNYVTSITPTAPGLAAVLAVSNDAAGTTITGLPTPSGSSDAAPKSYVDAQVTAAGNIATADLTFTGNRSHDGAGYDLTFNGLSSWAFNTPHSNIFSEDDHIAVGVSDGAVGASFDLSYSGGEGQAVVTADVFKWGLETVATREWVTAQGYSTGSINLTTTGSSGAATWDSVTRTLNIPQYSGGGGYTAGNGLLLTSTTFSADTVLLDTRGRLYKTIDSMKTVNAAIYQTALGFTPENVANKATSFGVLNNTLYPTTQAVSNYVSGLGYLTSASAASTYFPIAGGSITGTGGAGFVGLIPQTSAPSTPASGIRLYGSSTGAFTWKGTNGFQRTFSGSGITADRTYTLPDATGTLALTSDLTSYLTTATAATTYQPVFNPLTGTTFFSDFTSTAGEFSFVASGTGTNALSSVNTTANHPGRIRITTGTTSTGRMALQSSTNNSFALGGGATVFETQVYINNLSDGTDRYQLLVGLTSSGTSVNQTDGVFFLYDEGGVTTGSAASANWQEVTASSSTRTFATTSTAVAAAGWTKLRLEINAAGTSVQFYINGVAAGSPITTNIPTAGVVGWGVYAQKSLGTNTRNVDVDYVYVTQAFTTPR